MDSKHLKASKYAPRTPAESLAISRAERLKKEKEKATRLLDRLRWKAESLAASYTRALEILHAESNSNGFLDIHGETRYPFVLGMASKQAESMFKVDFFEFYTLLERYIELCLSIFGVSVSGNAPQTNFNALRYITNPDLQKTRPEASHAFHANLLEALDSEKCPLHASFGNQDVRIQLGLAKDYRNRWKDADEKVSTNKWGSEDHDSKRNTKLEDLELNRMIMTLLVGCEHAHGVVHDRADTTSGFKSRDFEPRDYEIMDTDDTPMEYMDDAMDLD